jgi:phosphoglycolate phosphatase
MSMAYDLISFDLDGTLIDTASEIAEAANRALETHGLERRPEAQITSLIGHGGRSLIQSLHTEAVTQDPAVGERLSSEQLFASFDAHYGDTTGTSSNPYPGTHQALERLLNAGVRLVCVTNKDYRHAVQALEVHQLATHFELVIGGDTLAQKKPHPSVLLHVARTLGIAPERLAHIGDSVTDVQAATNAGVAAWAVPYGYNGGIPITAANPDQLFHSLQEMADYVLGVPGVRLGTLPTTGADRTL